MFLNTAKTAAKRLILAFFYTACVLAVLELLVCMEPKSPRVRKRKLFGLPQKLTTHWPWLLVSLFFFGGGARNWSCLGRKIV